MSDQHGKLFDENFQIATSTHGGAQFDEGFQEQAKNLAHGPRYDNFDPIKQTDQKYGGASFDEFGWQDVQRSHGRHFDDDFEAPTAKDGKHGTWFDVFDGAEIRYVYEGADWEGTVIAINGDYATVESASGTHEVSFDQFQSYRSPAVHNASPPFPGRTDLSLPSADSSIAHGGEREGLPSGVHNVVDRVSPGASGEPSRIASSIACVTNSTVLWV